MEATYRASGVHTIILRAGDFLDTARSGNWFDQVITAKSAQGKFVYPGDPNIAHAWAYLPDMARAAVALAALRDRLPRFADIPFPGFTLTGAELAEHVGAALGRPQRMTGFSWWLIQALRPVWPLARGVTQMRYLWDKPHHLSQTEMTKILPNFVPTPVHQAVASALEVEVQPYQAVA